MQIVRATLCLAHRGKSCSEIKEVSGGSRDYLLFLCGLGRSLFSQPLKEDVLTGWRREARHGFGRHLAVEREGNGPNIVQ